MAKKKSDNSNNSKDKLKLNDERVKTSFGIFLVFTSLYIFLAFISYLFTWEADQSAEWITIWSGSEIEVDNWAGKMGARIAKQFMFNWFGIPSLVFPFLLFIIGMRLMNIRLLPLRKTLRISITGIIIGSIIMSFITGHTGGFLGSGLGGAHGYIVSRWLNSFLGVAGNGLFLFIVLFIWLAFSFNGFVKWFNSQMSKAFIKIKKLFSKRTQTIDEKPDDIDTTDFEQNTIEDNNLSEDLVKEVTGDGVELIFETPITENFEVSTIINDIAPEELEKNSDPGLLIQNATEEEFVEGRTLLETLGPYDPRLDLSGYKFPHTDLLEDHKSNLPDVSNEELIANKNKIVETLGNYKIQIDKIKATIGPTVTLYEIVPAPGIRISKIKSLEDDIALSLAALGIRIIAPIPGKGTIGIEVPNRNPKIVPMKSIITAKKFQESTADLAIAIGKTISDETFVFDLAKMPHLLVAGATGQGKSVGLNAIIASLLYKKHPAELKFVFVDPKKVELTLYTKIEKHFLAKLPDTEEAIITDTQKVITTLNSLCIEMDSRYDLLKKAHVRNLKEYNSKFCERRLNPENGHRFMPYIVLVIDEFADLIMTAGREVETPLARLAQLARAIGIHLVIATQRPTTNIITGVIKANFPARIAFRVTSMIDSRTILDSPGANQLIGRGDMLVSTGSDLIRVQCAFIDTPEIEKLTDYISSQQGYVSAMPLPEVPSEGSQSLNANEDEGSRDPLFEDAARLIVMHQQGSTSLIQRKFAIGYNRAGRLMDQLERARIVGPSDGSKARQVLIVDEISLEHLLKNQ